MATEVKTFNQYQVDLNENRKFVEVGTGDTAVKVYNVDLEGQNVLDNKVGDKTSTLLSVLTELLSGQNNMLKQLKIMNVHLEQISDLTIRSSDIED